MANSKFEESYKQKYGKVKKKKEKTNLVALRIPQSLYAKIKGLAKETETSMSQVMIDALKTVFLDESVK